MGKDSTNRPAWKRKRTYVYAVLAVLIGAYAWRFIDPHWEQDRCSFGPVSNAEYRAMKAEAENITGPLLSELRGYKRGYYGFDTSREDRFYRLVNNDDQKYFSKRIFEELNKFIQIRENNYNKIAAMHAFMSNILGIYTLHSTDFGYKGNNEFSYQYGYFLIHLWRHPLALISGPLQGMGRYNVKFYKSNNGAFNLLDVNTSFGNIYTPVRKPEWVGDCPTMPNSFQKFY